MTTSTFDTAVQLQTSKEITGITTFMFDAAGDQQIEQAPGGTITHTWDYKNQRTLVLLPKGAGETMTYNGDLRMQRKDP